MGILNIKDYVVALLQGKNDSLKDLMTEPLFISKRTKLNEALEIMQSERTHMAIVCNSKERKDFQGVITLEDILEELVGEIYDESDQIGLVQEVGTHKFLVDGETMIDYLFKEYLNDVPPTKKVMTVTQWVKSKSLQKTLKKSNPPIKYRNFIILVEDLSKKKKIFEFEVLTDQKPEKKKKVRKK